MIERDRIVGDLSRLSLMVVTTALLSACAVACGDSGSMTTEAPTSTSESSATGEMTTEAGTTVGATAGTTDPATTSGDASTGDASTGDASSTTTGDAPVGHAEFVLSGEDYDDVAFSWSNDGGNLVYCYFYEGAAKGDYLWIRFAESPEQNGDSSPHIDMDVCRFSAGGFGGSFSAMDPTKFGSQCPDDPGWGIWWHAGDVAYNNDPAAQPCQLEASVEGQVVTGTFSCTPVTEVDGDKSLTISGGSFSCLAEAK
ncbi:MAG: hypothetical protein H6713_29610 [Myxococcales bacterium]|nr:hypothetical protein [Myxococcales bacterium]